MFDPMSFLKSLGMSGATGGAMSPSGGWDASVTRGAISPGDMTGADKFRHLLTGTTDKSPLGNILGTAFGMGAKAIAPPKETSKPAVASPGPAPPPPGRNIAQITESIRGKAGSAPPFGSTMPRGPAPRGRPAFASPFAKG